MGAFATDNWAPRHIENLVHKICLDAVEKNKQSQTITFQLMVNIFDDETPTVILHTHNKRKLSVLFKSCVKGGPNIIHDVN